MQHQLQRAVFKFVGYIFCNNVDGMFNSQEMVVVNIEGCLLFRALPFTRDSTHRYIEG